MKEIFVELDAIFFILFVVSATWMMRMDRESIRYWLKNMKNWDHDSIRDFKFYRDVFKKRFGSLTGKIVIFFIIFYLVFCISKFVFLE